MKQAEELFLRLVRENDARLRRLCRIYAPDIERRRDLYQDILVQVWRSLDSYRGDASAATWLYRIALNTAMAARRTETSRPELVHDDELATLNSGHTAAASMEAENEENLENLYRAINRLPDTEKALLLLHLEDTSYRDMARVMGISENNVGVKLHRARQRIAKELEDGNHEMG
ncbi:MAG: RNA polymerase sigma factor [Gammaproteobacteria bacterium]|nr:RNA polymerase sigma factor [Gammaproteobacteria bacterium]